MRRFFSILILLISLFQNSVSQVPTSIDSAAYKGDYTKAIRLHLKEYMKDPNNAFNIYGLACKYSIINEIDSAFYFLNLAIDKGMDDGGAIYDYDFLNLHSSPLWRKVEQKLNEEYYNENQTINKELGFQLRAMYFKDQAIRDQWNYHFFRYGENSRQLDSVNKRMHEIDSINQRELDQIVMKYGWPTIKIAGKQGVFRAFIIVQHSPVGYQKKHLSEVENSVNAGELGKNTLALLTDKMLLNENKKQKFGSQLKYNRNTHSYELYPIENENEVNIRRKEFGLEPLEDYLKPWGINYILPAN